MRTRTIVGAIIAAIALVLGVAPAAVAAGPPAGYQLTAETSPAPGLVHRTYVREGPQPQVVNVARIRQGTELALRAVLSHEQIAGPGRRLERTSAMCQRVQCLVAINADFAMPGENSPVGGVIAAGELVRSFNTQHHQLSITEDGSLTTAAVGWSGTVMPTDLDPLTLTGINVPRRPDDLVLYTRHFGASTATNPHGVEVVLEPLERGAVARVGTTVAMRVHRVRDGEGSTPLGPDRFVLSGHGKSASALRQLGRRISEGEAGNTLLVRVETRDDVVQSVGGTPVLVREGQRWVGRDGPNFVSGRHPRTMAGSTADGTLLLVTVDGRQPGRSVGMSLAEAADLMIELGAVEAMNLDGGGSSTFVMDGEVVNRPSDRLVLRQGATRVAPVAGAADQVLGYLERPVVSALVVVPAGAATVAVAPPPVGESLEVPTTLAGDVHGLDPGSNPLAALPGLVVALDPGDPRGLPVGLAVAAVLLLVVTAAGVGAATRLRLP